MNTVSQFKQRLRENPPALLADAESPQAAVAMVIRFDEDFPEVLLIERAYNAHDPWSGHLALPGGRMEPHDQDLKQTAVRETREETGLGIHSSDFLGRLSDVDAVIAPLAIACFVYQCPQVPALSLDSVEVADAFWVPLFHLETRREMRIKQRITSGTKEVPAIRIPGRDQPIWGITLKFIREVRQLLVVE